MKPFLQLLGDRYKAQQFVRFAERKLGELKTLMKRLNLSMQNRFYRFINDNVEVYIESYHGFDKIRISAVTRIIDILGDGVFELPLLTVDGSISVKIKQETRYKQYLGVGSESEESCHANFLLADWEDPWDDDLTNPGITQTPHYLGGKRGSTWLYRARERRTQYNLVTTPRFPWTTVSIPFTAEIQVYNAVTAGFGTSGGNIYGYWEENPSVNATLETGNQGWFGLWSITDIDVPLVATEGSQIITSRIQDLSYPFLNSGNSSDDFGWLLNINKETGTRIVIT